MGFSRVFLGIILGLLGIFLGSYFCQAGIMFNSSWLSKSESVLQGCDFEFILPQWLNDLELVLVGFPYY